MAEQTFGKAFGLNATQNANDIVVKKSDLQMTAAATNRSEQTAAAMIRQFASAFTKADWDTNPDANIYAEYGQQSTTFRTIGQNSENLSLLSVTFFFSQPAITPVIEPDDY